jgi:hypothetical protein
MRFTFPGGASMSFQPIMWQSFGTGQSFDPKDILFGSHVTVGPQWKTYRHTFNVPSISGKTISTVGDDYIGIGFESPGLMGIVDIANVRITENATGGNDGIVSTGCTS